MHSKIDIATVQFNKNGFPCRHGLGASSSGKSASLKILANRLLMLEMQERLKYAESLKLKEHEAIGAVVELIKEPTQMSFEDSQKQEVQVEPEAPKAEEKEEPKDLG